MTLVVVAGFSLVLAAGCGNFTAQSRNAAGVRLFDHGQYQAALREFQEGNNTDPNNPDGYYNLARTYHRLGQVENRQRDLDQAESYYRQCLAKNCNHADCYRGLAVLLAEQGRTDEAFKLVEGWVAGEPGSADAKIELARMCEECGDQTEAKEHLFEALQVDPESPRALAALGKIREDMGQPAEALRNYERSLANDRFQPLVASRVSVLRSTMNPPLATSTLHGGTRLVDRTSVPLR